MSRAEPFSLSRLRRMRWLPRVAVTLSLVMFLAAGLAQAAHLHKSDIAAGDKDMPRCELCLQFDRLVCAPADHTAPLGVTPSVPAPQAACVLPLIPLLFRPYKARAPPAA